MNTNKLRKRETMYQTCNDCGEDFKKTAFPDNSKYQIASVFCNDCSKTRIDAKLSASFERDMEIIRLFGMGKHPDSISESCGVSSAVISRSVDMESFRAYLLEIQGNRCAVCGTSEPKQRRNGCWAVDHDHSTGRIRGVLCTGCNFMLGNAEDRIETLKGGIAYLIKNRTNDLIS